MTTSVASHVYSSFSPIFIASKADYSQPNQKKAKHSRLQNLPLPQFDEEVLLTLCQEATVIFKNTPSVVVIEPPVYVIGDLNGSIYDLTRILSKSESFSTHRFIFLGNYIGTGLFSLECLALLYSLVCLCPRNIILLRGSTEFADVSEKLGFAQELQQNDYSKELHDAFQESFQWLPFSALISRTYMVAHGRINDDIMTLDDVCRIERPIKYFDPSSSAISAMSSNSNEPFEKHVSNSNQTGTLNLGNSAMQSIVGPYTNCFYFKDIRVDKSDDDDDIENQVLDKHILRAFLRHNKLQKFICGNVASPKGVASFVKGRCITVFSMQNYTNNKNKAGFLFIQSENNQQQMMAGSSSDLVLRGHCLPLMHTPTRRAVHFQKCVMPKKERRSKNPRVFTTIIKSSMKKQAAKPHSNPSSDIVMQPSAPGIVNMSSLNNVGGTKIGQANSRVFASFSASALESIPQKQDLVRSTEDQSNSNSPFSTASNSSDNNSVNVNQQQQMQFNKYVTQVPQSSPQNQQQQFNKFVTQVPQTSPQQSQQNQQMQFNKYVTQVPQQQQQQQQSTPQQQQNQINQFGQNSPQMQFINRPISPNPIGQQPQQQVTKQPSQQMPYMRAAVSPQSSQQQQQLQFNKFSPTQQQQTQQQQQQSSQIPQQPSQGRFQRFQPFKPTQPVAQQQPVYFQQQPKSSQANKFMKMIAANSKRNTYGGMEFDNDDDY